METGLVVMVRGASVTTQQETFVPKEMAPYSAVVRMSMLHDKRAISLYSVYYVNCINHQSMPHTQKHRHTY